ncbi:outer membrane beta-barrel protein [Flavisolibacter ginsenosidimutans]|uniref:Porin n=1 Tax=Flavisolibacter ginsenosidimutans TaxID=661481 RepID=A0A5B8UGZ9_9BACT|nr:outer membrane beta-barrel protein [Flavisolibacter ginsenosidimutans]QEC55904.1 porin [Flavisolibacter ginsenosidimutans]
MLRNLILSGMAISLLNNAFAQDSTKPASSLSVTGSADLYYKYDFGKSKANNLTSFTNSHNTFELGMASVKLDYKSTKVELVADLGFGKRAQEFSYNDAGILQAVKQLYISYSLNNWLKLTAGSWATHVGYELVDAYANRNYSMSYMFTNGPFFHTGVKAEASYGTSGFMVGIANPTDYKYVPDGVLNHKTFLAQYSYAPSDLFKAYINFVGGQNIDSSKTHQYDLVLTSKLSSKFSLGYNGTLNRTTLYFGKDKYDEAKSWWGSALYVNFDPSKTFGLTLREEYFNDDKQLKMFGSQPKGGSIFASTLSANIRADNFTFIPEFRLDKASQTLFTDASAKPVKWSANVLFAAVYQF